MNKTLRQRFPSMHSLLGLTYPLKGQDVGVAALMEATESVKLKNAIKVLSLIRKKQGVR